MTESEILRSLNHIYLSIPNLDIVGISTKQSIASGGLKKKLQTSTTQ